MKAPKGVLVVDREKLLVASRALALHRDLILSAIEKQHEGMGKDSRSMAAISSLRSVREALRMIVEDDYRGPETPGGS